ncbi:hypothetical protein [Thermaerobacter subterraneus]|uniref:Uncharacterized protein n=1 Tax=Thermaerobacter subterraneus DSM 13965 TaxID=867903 RepID=K6PS38_9FIRM|nr:hypothetical protein [Thermaerobacter subterraneus]EKP95772.1 hypothetical protein ThesuDRAFT_01532 [Thermaerobacter subterraneus DSM 13965]
MRWLAWTLAGLAAGPAALALYIRRQGDADVRVDARGVTILDTHRDAGRWQVRFRLPVVNRGRQKGMLYEILVRPEFPGRWAAPARWSVAFFWPGVQETGYWSATLLKPGQEVPLEIELTAYGPEEVLDRLARLERLDLVVRHGVIGRTPLRWYLTDVHLPLAGAGVAKAPQPFRAAEEPPATWGSVPGGRPPAPAGGAGRAASPAISPGDRRGRPRPTLTVVARRAPAPVPPARSPVPPPAWPREDAAARPGVAPGRAAAAGRRGSPWPR